MEQSLDTIGEHFVTVTYQSEIFKKDFTFYVKVIIRPKNKPAVAAAAPAKAASKN